MKKGINILLVDDHPMLRQGLAAILNFQEDMVVVHEAAGMADSLAAIESAEIDVAIVDYSLKGELGSDVAKALLKIKPTLQVMGISSFSSKSSIKSMVKAGARGFVLKDAEVPELLEAVRATAAGQNFFSRDVSTILLDDLINQKTNPSRPQYSCKPEDLTNRELDVLKYIVDENTTKDIANELHLSTKTVENHRQNLMQKIGARNIAGIVRFAFHNKLVD